MSKDDLVKVIDYWQSVSEEKDLFPRTMVEEIDLVSREVVDIVGVRRSGKSSVLKLLINKLKKGGNCLYINFEDPFFVSYNTPQVIEELIEIYGEYFSGNLKYLFFDEIQNIGSWEKVVRKLRDGGYYKIFVTGSSSKFLGGEYASTLSGRHLTYSLMPLSFYEFLFFKGLSLKNKKDTVVKEKQILRLFEEYLLVGGFPEIVLTGKMELLKEYYSDIVEKDIIGRYQVREKEILNKMGIFLTSNSGNIISFSSLKKLYDISFEAVASYIGYFKEAFLISDLTQFSYSLKTQQKALKKYYSIDSGLAASVSFRFSEDKGRMLENLVFLEIMRRGLEVFYYKTANNQEVDFVVRNKTYLPIQVSLRLGDVRTKDREVKALVKAMQEFSVSYGLILTLDTKDMISEGNRTIEMKPVYRWMLENEKNLTLFHHHISKSRL